MARINKTREYEIPYSLRFTDADGSLEWIDVLVTYEVDGADSPARYCRSIGTWDPPEFASAEVLSVTLDGFDGVATPRPDLIPIVQADKKWEAAALDYAEKVEQDAQAAAEEARWESAREERWFGREGF